MNNPKFSTLRKQMNCKILVVFFLFCLGGCTTTILDKHNEVMQSNPGKVHYATAVPFGAYNLDLQNRRAAYQSACIYYNDYPSFKRKAESPWQWFSGMGGGSQEEVESYVVNQCETKTERTCIVLLYNNIVRCEATFESAFTREQERVRWRQDGVNRASAEVQKKKSQQMTETCVSFGFKANSSELSACVLELHKSLQQIEAINNASNRQASAIEAANAANIKLREFEQGMILLQRGSDQLDPTRSSRHTLKCRYDTIMQTINCN